MKCWKNRWKRKAVKRRLENRRLEKRIKELTISRDTWKNKIESYEERIEELKNELKKNE